MPTARQFMIYWFKCFRPGSFKTSEQLVKSMTTIKRYNEMAVWFEIGLSKYRRLSKARRWVMANSIINPNDAFKSSWEYQNIYL